jgi:hypothetical protein
VAASIAFPDGTLTAGGLRKEARRGKLKIERIAGKDYTTLASIEAMRHQCLLIPNTSSKQAHQGQSKRSAAVVKAARAKAAELRRLAKAT